MGAEAAAGVPSEKFSQGVDNIFAYQADEVVLNQGDWVSFRADNGTQTNADGSSALVSTMANGGLFQMDEDGYFTLTPGQGVTFDNVLQLSGGATRYVVEETVTVDVDSQFAVESPECSINGLSKSVTELTGADGSYIYRTEALELETEESSSRARSEKTQLLWLQPLLSTATTPRAYFTDKTPTLLTPKQVSGEFLLTQTEKYRKIDQ